MLPVSMSEDISYQPQVAHRVGGMEFLGGREEVFGEIAIVCNIDDQRHERNGGKVDGQWRVEGDSGQEIKQFGAHDRFS